MKCLVPGRMDTEVIEDMLFGVPDSQESFDDLWSEDSDDELLDAADMDYESDDDLFDDPVEVTTDSWQLSSSPFLKATQDTEGSHNNMAMADRSISREKDKFALVDASKNLPRDRCCAVTWQAKHALIMVQTLGNSLCRSHVGTNCRWSPRRQRETYVYAEKPRWYTKKTTRV